MRTILATTATALAVSVVMSTVVFAQKTKTDAAKASRAEATGSLNDSYNRCVTLARSRGYTASDLDGNRAAARNFVVRCMQGKQR
jgi:hypothetical protein